MGAARNSTETGFQPCDLALLQQHRLDRLQLSIWQESRTVLAVRAVRAPREKGASSASVIIHTSARSPVTPVNEFRRPTAFTVSTSSVLLTTDACGRRAATSTRTAPARTLHPPADIRARVRTSPAELRCRACGIGTYSSFQKSD